ncbi:MAG TPA: DUF6496 domain-containing protein, partial [Bryobacteraceae bacterium]|nr:DUF6496 domain-containing protein [Bryobacteraceae bacterium]
MATKKSTRKAQSKVGKAMHEYKRGQLKSGGRRKVTSRKQAIAIGLSEARREGANIPRKGAAKKRAAKKGAKRTGTKKRTATRRGAKRSAAKRRG